MGWSPLHTHGNEKGPRKRPLFAERVEPTAAGEDSLFGAVGRLNWLPECASMRSRHRGPAEPEVWFRITHITLENTAGSAAYREQIVEVALGPKGAFENGNIGTLTRRVPANQVVSAVPPPRGKPRPPKVPQTPPLVEFLRKAIEWQALLESGEAKSQADIAQREGISRPRLNQIMCLVRLTYDIQQHILAMPETIHRPPISERALRSIARLEDLTDQKARFQQLIGEGQ